MRRIRSLDEHRVEPRSKNRCLGIKFAWLDIYWATGEMLAVLRQDVTKEAAARFEDISRFLMPPATRKSEADSMLLCRRQKLIQINALA